jgi:hypothetical protein
MEAFDRKKHWENIYQTKELKDVSWFQPTPETSFWSVVGVPANHYHPVVSFYRPQQSIRPHAKRNYSIETNWLAGTPTREQKSH